MTAASLALAAALLRGAPASTLALLGDGRGRVTSVRPPSVSLSLAIEPPALATGMEPEPPVVLPGYLLPDDGIEEPADGGG
jgi:hypothetical protein